MVSKYWRRCYKGKIKQRKTTRYTYAYTITYKKRIQIYITTSPLVYTNMGWLGTAPTEGRFAMHERRWDEIRKVITTNGDIGCRWWQTTGRLTAQIGWLGLRCGGRLTLSLHSLYNPSELLRWLCYGDSLKNSVIGVTRTHSTFGDWEFAAAGPKLRNSLSTHLKEADIYWF